MPPTARSMWTYLPNQHRILKTPVVPVDWSRYVRDEERSGTPEDGTQDGSLSETSDSIPLSQSTEAEIAHSPEDKPSLIVTLALPARGERVQNPGLHSLEHAENQDLRIAERGRNTTYADGDVEILDSRKDTKRRTLDFGGENRNPFRKSTISGVTETDMQHYERLASRFRDVEAQGGKAKRSTKRSIIFDEPSGDLMYMKRSKTRKERAVFHHWIRDEISEVENVKGEDEDNLEHGILSGDITCFSSVNGHSPIPVQSGNPVGYLRYNGMLVIDHDLLPVRAFPDFPLVLSSQFAGSAMMAAQLRNPEIRVRDFWARMPPIVQEDVNGKLVLMPLYSVEALGARMSQSSADTDTVMEDSPDKLKDEDQQSVRRDHTSRSSTMELVPQDEDEQPSQVHAHTQWPELTRTHFAALRFWPKDKADQRNRIPRTADDAAALQESLDITAAHFHQLTGREPVRNQGGRTTTYCAQWMDMQNQLKQIWERTPPAPSLISRRRWIRGFANWESAELSGRG